jgi:hypothetical protein
VRCQRAVIPFLMILAARMDSASAGSESMEAKVISIAEAQCASMNQRYPSKSPHVGLSHGVWEVQWPPMEGTGDYLVASVNGSTLKPMGCVIYSLTPYTGPLPADAKPN